MIKEMTTESEIKATFPVMKQLRTHLSEEQYLAMVKRQRESQNYHLAAVIEDGQIQSLAGYRIAECLSYGQFLYVDDLITDEKARSKNHGRELMNWLIDEAKKWDCRQLHLDSGVQRHSAHRFYLRERMDITCFHFGLVL
ncbi:MAG TPA: GNAT family N-acetyltransferase [Pyrinomonadaceae bacterium]